MTRFVLPKTQQSRNWIRSTDTLRAHLQQRLVSVHARAEAKRKEAEEIEKESAALEQAIALLDQLLPAKAGQQTALPAAKATRPGFTVDRLYAGAEAGEAEIVHVLPGAVKDGKRFSLMHEACTKCGRGPSDGVKHAAKGLCQACYWNETHPKSDTDLDEAVALAANGAES